MKKIMTFSLTALLALTLTLTVGSGIKASAEAAVEPAALFIDSFVVTDGEGGHAVNMRFKQSLAAEAKDVTENLGGFILINGAELKTVAGAKLEFVAEEPSTAATEPSTDTYHYARAFLPQGTLKADGNDKIYIQKGFTGDTEYVTTVRYMYSVAANNSVKRIYRSDNIDDYGAVSVDSVSLLESQGTNRGFYVYLDSSIVSKKMVDMSVREAEVLKAYHGSAGDNQYTDIEIDILNQYEIIDYRNSNSLMYKIQFGCESYNGMKAFPGNNAGAAYDMTPMSSADGIDLYNIFQIQEQVADRTIFYVDTDGKKQNNGASQQPLCMQIHMENNGIQLIFKADSMRDRSATEFYDYHGNKLDVTSFNENIAPASSERMAISLKVGLLFPNGKMLKEDVTYVYEPSKKMWLEAGTDGGEAASDTTLSNQEGYTDEEIAALNPAADGGCGGFAFGFGSLGLTLAGLAAAGIALRRKSAHGIRR